MTDQERVQQRFLNIEPLSVGRIVHYVLPKPDWRGCPVIRPAMVVQVWSNTCANLQVFLDGVNDCQYIITPRDPGLMTLEWATSSTFDMGETRSNDQWRYVHYNPQTWHWPPRGATIELVSPQRIMQSDVN